VIGATIRLIAKIGRIGTTTGHQPQQRTCAEQNVFDRVEIQKQRFAGVEYDWPAKIQDNRRRDQ
jgi:hypothetical protein